MSMDQALLIFTKEKQSEDIIAKGTCTMPYTSGHATNQIPTPHHALNSRSFSCSFYSIHSFMIKSVRNITPRFVREIYMLFIYVYIYVCVCPSSSIY